AAAAGPMVRNGAIAPELIGAWRMLGEGRLVEISATGVQQFQEAPTMCYADASASTTDLADLQDLHFSATASKVDLFELDGAPAAHTLEKIGAIPAACRTPVASTPARTYEALCEIMSQDYAFFEARKVDWEARCHQFGPTAARASTDDELQAALVSVLDGIGDAHVKLYRDQDGERRQVFSGMRTATLELLKQAFAQQDEVADLRTFQLGWREEVLAQVQARLEGGGTERLGGAMRYGRLPGNVGYIGLHRMLGFSNDGQLSSEVALAGAAIDEALGALASTRMLIVDVSFNGGGSDLVSAEIAARFADQPRLAFTKHWQRPQGRAPQPWTVSPKGAARYTKPVYLLTSDLTGSAGETFTLMMRQMPQVIHAGQPTLGSISDILERPLPGHFTVTFSNEIDLDPAGQSWEARGIPPALPLQLFDPARLDTLLTGHGAALDALLAR
ncbi:MAG: S41 family peptidase, partial [Gammaproteobacteria bacterium]